MNDKLLTIVIAMYILIFVGCTIAAYELLLFIGRHLHIGWH